jgi:pimeloyl-ACP methyl ester carboxylesterase
MCRGAGDDRVAFTVTKEERMSNGSRLGRWGLRCLVLALVVGSLGPAPAAVGATAPRTHHVDIGDVTLAYRSFGQGRPLVLLSGAGAAMDVWDPLMIRVLSVQRRVIVFDYRGVGGSTDDPDVPLTIDLLAEDTVGLLRALDLGRADVLGWSLGGYVAQRLIELHPRRVRHLVLISTDPGGPNAVLAAPDILELDARVTLGHATLEEIFALLFPHNQLDTAQAWLGRYLSQPGCCESVPVAAGRRQLRAEHRWQTGSGAWYGLSRITRPTLILRGARDIDVPPTNEQLIARRIRNSVLVTFADAGHGLPLQAPTLVAGLVNGFLGPSR